MSRKILGSLLSFLLVFMLVLPAVGAEGNQWVQSAGEKRVVSKLDPSKIALEDKIDTQDLILERMQSRNSINSANQLAGMDGLVLEQLDSSQETAITPQNYVPASDGTQTIPVIVELQEQPVKVSEATASQRMLQPQDLKVNQEQLMFKQEALKKLRININREYKQIFNGFAMTIPADQVDSLLQMPGVRAVYPDNVVYAAEDTSVSPMMVRSAPHIGTPDLWNLGVTGDGVKVGILDTGIAKDHPDLVGAIESESPYWGYDFVDDDDQPYETTKQDYLDAKALDPDLPEYNESGRPYWTSHGTHVAGTVAGQEVGVDDQDGIKGIAPDATIYSYRVLGPYGSGFTSDIIAALEQAVVDQMDVINMSLGSQSNNAKSADSIAVNNVMKAGVIAVVSNGNSGPGEATVTDPGSAELVISVGASKPPLLTPIMKAEEISGSEFFMDTFDKSQGIETLTGSYELVYVGLGGAEDYTGKDLTGKIAFIQRGTHSFELKANNAMASGAIAAVVYNNVPEALESGTLGNANVTIPIYTISGAYGEQIRAVQADGTVHVSFDSTKTEADIMASFSSRGPSKPSYDIKPDIAAPGIGIVSSVPEYEGWYEANNGTSMAAPHIAGAAALMKQMFSNLDQYEIKALLMNNAVKLIGRNGERYTHMDQGAGRVALDAVVNAKAVAKVEDMTDSVADSEEITYYTGSLSYGYVGLGESADRTVVVKDIAGQTSSYEVELKWYGEGSGDLTSTVSEVEVLAGGEASFEVNVTVSPDAEEIRYEGEVVLTEAGGHVIQLPVAVYAGEAPVIDPVTNLTLTPDIFSPNGDELLDTTTIAFTVTEPLEYFSLDVFTVDFDYLGTIIKQPLDSGSWSLRWDGSDLPDGEYAVIPFAGSSYDDAEPIINSLALFIIDREAPVVQLDDPAIRVDLANLSGTISGQITKDLLIDLLVTPGYADMSDVIGVAAYQLDGEQQFDGTIDETGRFSVEVPITLGANVFELYVYDLAVNGIMEPVEVVEYDFINAVTPVLIPNHVLDDEEFSLDVRFNVTSAVYSAKFDLIYPNAIAEGSVVASPQLAAHQQLLNPDAGLTVSEAVYEDGNMNRHEFYISLNGTPGYSGKGSLATFQFSSAPVGEHTFTISNLEMLDQNGNPINVEAVSDTLLSVVEPVEPELLVMQNPLHLKAGESEQLLVNYINKYGQRDDVTLESTYSIADETIVSIDENAAVTALKEGQTEIMATYSGLSVTVPVTVTQDNEPPAGEAKLTATPESISLAEGETKKLSVSYEDAEGAVTDVTEYAQYVPESLTTVSVDKGTVKAQKEGSTVINITYGDSSDNVKVTVTKKPSSPAVFFPGIIMPEQPETDNVKMAIKANEAITITLKNGITLRIPANAITQEGAAYVEVRPATEEATQELLKSLNLGSEMKPQSVYFDIVILDKDSKELPSEAFVLPVQASIPVSALTTDDLDSEKVNLYKIDDQGNLTLHIGRVADDQVTVSFNSPSRYMFMGKDMKFSDVTNASLAWAIREIEVLASKDMINGRTAAAFVPRAEVTRAEFIAMLVRALGLQAGDSAPVQFSDVQAGSWYYEAVQIAVANGLITGYADQTFAPLKSITRAEMAVILSRTLAKLGSSGGSEEFLSSFEDRASIQAWAKEGVAHVVELGIMQGKGHNLFAGKALTTRAEAAVVIYRMFKGYTK